MSTPTRIIYQVQGEEFDSQAAGMARMAEIIGLPVHSVDWLDVTSIQDGANGIRRFIAGIVNESIEPDDDSDLERYFQKYRQPKLPPADAPDEPDEAELD